MRVIMKPFLFLALMALAIGAIWLNVPWLDAVAVVLVLAAVIVFVSDVRQHRR